MSDRLFCILFSFVEVHKEGDGKEYVEGEADAFKHFGVAVDDVAITGGEICAKEDGKIYERCGEHGKSCGEHQKRRAVHSFKIFFNFFHLYSPFKIFKMIISL